MGISQRGAVDSTVTRDVDRAIVSDGPAGDRRTVQRQRRSRINGEVAGIGDIDENVERAAGNFDGSGAGIRDRALVFEVAALLKGDETGVLQHTGVQHFHRAANGDGAEILHRRVSAETECATDRQRARINQLGMGIAEIAEVIEGHRLGDGRRHCIDRDGIRRRQTDQLVGNDDDVIGRRWYGTGFPVRRIAPKPPRRRALGYICDPDDGRSIIAGNGDNDVLGGDRALRILHLHGIGEGKRLAAGYEVGHVSWKLRKRPVDGSGPSSSAVRGN